MILEIQKLTTTSFIVNMKHHSVSGPSFRSRSENWDTHLEIQDHSYKRVEISLKFWEIYNNFSLARQNLINHVELQIRHIILL
jgi:hypothetical protein